MFRAGYALAYNRPGMSDFSDVFGAIPASRSTANRDTALGNLNQDGLGLPVLLRDRGRLGPPNNIPLTQQYPFTEVITGDLNIFDPEPAGAVLADVDGEHRQRKITRDIGIDVRYVGTRSPAGLGRLQLQRGQHHRERVPRRVPARPGQPAGEHRRRHAANTLRLHRRARNLAAADLPGVSERRSAVAVRRHDHGTRATSWTSTDFTNPLAIYNPNPFTPAGTNSNTGLDGDPARRTNAADRRPAGELLPRQSGSAGRRAHHRQRRLQPLRLGCSSNCESGCRNGFEFADAATCTGRPSRRSARRCAPAASKREQTGSEGNVVHAFKANWVYELPFGQGRRFLTNSGGWLDRLVGGWEFDGIARIQSGRLLDFGNVRLVGMTADELRSEIGIQEFAVTGLNAERSQRHLPAAAGHHREHGASVQRERHLGDRLRQHGRADRALPGARQLADLHRDHPRHRAVRTCARSSSPGRSTCGSISAPSRGSRIAGQHELRVPRRDAQRVQPS